jgi:methionine biosynthesis protein MetW
MDHTTSSGSWPKLPPRRRVKYDATLTASSLALRPFAADAQVLAFVRAKSRVLDVGCSTGFMGDYLQKERGCQVWGVEADQDAARHARQVLQGVEEGDLDNPNFVKQLKGTYDVIILAAVLEHLKHPLPALEHCKQLLAPGGKMIISLPNVAHIRIRLRLLGGDFTYGKYGILDETHCKLYTKATAKDLLQQAGLKIQHFTVSFPFPGASQIRQYPFLMPIMKAIAHTWPTLVGEELIFVAQPR